MVHSTIVVNGRSIKYEQELIDIFSIEYFLENPRINYIISQYNPEDITPKLIEKTLLMLDSTKELEEDIFQNKGLLEPVLVLNNVVIEGNTRLCCYRRLYERFGNQWQYIKANVIKESLSTEEVFAILSNYHLKGKKKWDLYEKAAYINKMVSEGKSIDEVAKTIGSTRPKVEDMLKAYNVMKNNYLTRIKPEYGNGEIRENLRKFSYFEAFFINKNLSNRAEQTPGFIDEFVGWVAEGRIPKAQDVRELHNILDNKKARKLFVESEPEEAFNEAQQCLYFNKPEKIDVFYKRLDQFRDLLLASDVNKIKEDVATNKNMKYAVTKCFTDFKKFCKEIDIDLKEINK